MSNEASSPSGDSQRTPSPRQTDSPRRILVVDDDAFVRQLSTGVLIRSGFQVDAAADGADAWNALQLASYDLLVTDHDMRRLTGVGLIQKVQAAHMALPVILMSAQMPTDELRTLPRLQIDATLRKPFTTGELLGAVRTALRTTDNSCEQIEPPANRAGPL